MDDPFARLSEQEIADACAYADGTLPEERLAEVETRVLASTELTALVARQRRSLAATRALAREPMPASLAHILDGPRSRAVPPERRRRRRLGLVLSGAGVLAAVLVAFFALSLGGPNGPTVAAAADFALQSPSAAAPAAMAGSGKLDAVVGGVWFPDYSVHTGWRAVGRRTGELDGRPVTVVYYENAGRRVGYAIVGGAALARPDGKAWSHGGVEYRSLAHQGRQVVTWRVKGHTCVLVGPVPAKELAALATFTY